MCDVALLPVDGGDRIAGCVGDEVERFDRLQPVGLADVPLVRSAAPVVSVPVSPFPPCLLKVTINTSDDTRSSGSGVPPEIETRAYDDAGKPALKEPAEHRPKSC